eukprot:2015490-Amphidinium_carterae.4
MEPYRWLALSSDERYMHWPYVCHESLRADAQVRKQLESMHWLVRWVSELHCSTGGGWFEGLSVELPEVLSKGGVLSLGRVQVRSGLLAHCTNLLRTSSSIGRLIYESRRHEVCPQGGEGQVGPVHDGSWSLRDVPLRLHVLESGSLNWFTLSCEVKSGVLHPCVLGYRERVHTVAVWGFTKKVHRVTRSCSTESRIEKMADKQAKKRLRDMDSDDQVDWYNRQAEIVQNRGLAKRLCVLVRNQPEVMPGILTHLKSKGIKLPELQRKRRTKRKGVQPAEGSEDDDDDDDGEETEGEACKREEKEGKKKSMASRLRKGSGIVDENEANWIPHCYTTLGCCRCPVLLPILESISAVAYSPYNLTGYKRKLGNPSAEIFQRKLMELICFASGVESSMPLVGDMRHIPALKAELRRRADEEFKWRCNQMVLPPDWSKCGVYILKMEKERILLQERYCAQRVFDVTIRAVAAFNGATVGELNLHVVNNYSEKSAQVVNLVTGGSKLAIELMGEAGAAEGAQPGES